MYLHPIHSQKKKREETKVNVEPKNHLIYKHEKEVRQTDTIPPTIRLFHTNDHDHTQDVLDLCRLYLLEPSG